LYTWSSTAGFAAGLACAQVRSAGLAYAAKRSTTQVRRQTGVCSRDKVERKEALHNPFHVDGLLVLHARSTST